MKLNKLFIFGSFPFLFFSSCHKPLHNPNGPDPEEMTFSINEHYISPQNMVVVDFGYEEENRSEYAMSRNNLPSGYNHNLNMYTY